MTDAITHFLDQLLAARSATIRRESEDTLSIEIPLGPVPVPAELADELEEETVETSIVLDGIEPGAGELRGRSLTFPVNPEEGYIDGSLYLAAAHNPVDVTRIDFAADEGADPAATLHGQVDFAFEGPEVLGVRAFVLEVALRWEDGLG
jgi:hypothetical protein